MGVLVGVRQRGRHRADGGVAGAGVRDALPGDRPAARQDVHPERADTGGHRAGPVGAGVPMRARVVPWRGAARAGVPPERAGHVGVRHGHRLVLHGHLAHRGAVRAARDRDARRQDRLGPEMLDHGWPPISFITAMQLAISFNHGSCPGA